MKYARIGDTGLIVSRLSLGSMTFGDIKSAHRGLSTVGQSEADALVARALVAGINSFNSGATYGGGASEVILGRALGKRRADCIITTKVGFRGSSVVSDAGLSARNIIKTAEDSLRRLGTDWIDIFQLHRVDRFAPMEESLEALDQLVRQGKVRYAGCANWPAGMIGRASGLQDAGRLARFRVAEMLYTLISRDIEHSHFDLFRDTGIGLFVWSPLAGGLLTGKYTRENRKADGRMSRTYEMPFDWDLAFDIVDMLRVIAEPRGVTPAAVALAWLLARPEVTSVLVGVTSPAQLEQNLSAITVDLTAEELARLDQASQTPSPYPNWFNHRNLDRISEKALAP